MSTPFFPNSSCDATGDRDHHCITCSDEGVPMDVVAMGESAGLAWCIDAAGERSEVMTMLVDSVVVGDTLLVHAGTALLRVANASSTDALATDALGSREESAA